MAGVRILEQNDEKAFLDDTTPLSAQIITNKVVHKEKYVEYVIKVNRGPDESWEVSHRYSDFDSLSSALQPSGIPTPLPPKKMLRTLDPQFITEREQGLKVFLATILSEPHLSNRLEVKKFLDPKNYSGNFYENALRNVSMFFRSHPNWEVMEPLKDFGCRIRKQYYLIRNKDETKSPQHVLSCCEPGPDFSFSEKEIEASLKVLAEIKHPFILSPVLANFTGTGLMIVREFVAAGSLKDAIYGKNPKNSSLEKYGQPARPGVLKGPQIKQYGRQVLEALNFLIAKGFVAGHVHAGNVLIYKDGNCRLVDTENSLMGVPSPYRHHLVTIKRLRSHMGETVYSFGHMLYEMCAGSPLKTATIEGSCPTSFPAASIINSILTPQAIKEGLPTLSDLLANPFFSEGYGVAPSEKPYLRVPSKLKEVLKGHLEKAEHRLLDEQKKVAQHRRVSKAHENLMSEDEKKKKRKMLRKKQMSMQEDTEPQSYPTTTSLPRQNTIGTSGVTHSKKQTSSSSSLSSSSTPTTNGTANTNSSNSTKSAPTKVSAPAKAPPPPSSAAPEPRPAPPANRGERGALLGSIEGFTKGKLKKTVTSDRSGPFVRR